MVHEKERILSSDKSHAPRVFDSALIFPYIVSYLRHLETGEGGANPRRGRVSMWNAELKIG